MKKLVCFCVLISLFACKKEEKQPVDFCVDAMVRWGGTVAADGMEWYLADSANRTRYKPDNLPDDMKLDNLRVNVCLFLTKKKYSCFCAEPLPVYHISSIRRR